MRLDLQRVSYSELTAKQREIYNYQKVAAVLADYGFNCIKLDDDWQGADFLAYHKDGETTLKVQLKGRGLSIDRKYLKKDLYLCFGSDEARYLIPHDELVKIIGEKTNSLESPSWTKQHYYYSGNPSKAVLEAIAGYKLEPPRN